MLVMLVMLVMMVVVNMVVMVDGTGYDGKNTLCSI